MTHKSDDLKITAVRYYMKCHNQVGMCRIFECSERSLMRWVDRFRGRRNGRTPTSSKHRQQGGTTTRKLHSQTRQTTSCHHDGRSARGGIGAFSGFGHFTTSSRNHRTGQQCDFETFKSTTRKPTHRYGKQININSELDPLLSICEESRA